MSKDRYRHTKHSESVSSPSRRSAVEAAIDFEFAASTSPKDSKGHEAFTASFEPVIDQTTLDVLSMLEEDQLKTNTYNSVKSTRNPRR